MQPELIEYTWNERDELGEFLYQDPETGLLETQVRAQPLQVSPSLETYWGQLIVYLKTQVLA